jgi:hypothetical protein
MSDLKLVAEWVQKAEGDFQTATRMMRWRKNHQKVRIFIRDKLGLKQGVMKKNRCHFPA